MFPKRPILIACCVLLAGAGGFAQTFEVNGQNNPPSSAAGKNANRGKQQGKAAGPRSDTGMGWGSSIEVARQARAAQEALNKGDYAAAMNYAERATRAAPHNPDFWFLLAYSARLAGKYSTSVDAYQKGLAERPSSIEGLSGLAQTYAKMGKASEAEALLQKVLAANPKSTDDLRLAGELFLFKDPQQSLTYFSRAEGVKPDARTELLMARAYQRTGQQDQARQMLDRARNRAPNNAEVLRSVAGYLRDTGQYDQAIAILQSIKKKDANSLAEMAFTYQLAGKKKEAADRYLQAANAAKSDIDIQLNAAQALVNAGEFGAAENLLKRAQALQPDHYRLHAIRGQIAALENRPDEGIREYETALSHLPESVPEGVLYPISLHVDLYQLFRDTGNAAGQNREASAARNLIQQIDVRDANRPEFLRLRAAVEMAFNNSQGAEKDLKEALSLQPNNTNIILNYANLLWRTDRRPEAVQLYNRGLQSDPTNAAALSSLGYLSREMGNPKAAEQYFTKVESLYPDNYVPHLALGDLYTERREFKRAQASYDKAHRLAPTNPLVVAGGINSALESHQFQVAKDWIDHSTPDMLENPQVMREHERYLTMTGKYQESADLGYKVIEKLPRDPEAPVYLAYDLLFLNRYQDAMQIVRRFEPVLPKDKDLRLIAGYVDAHNGDLQAAVNDFSEALERDPQMSTGYMNRGYVENDLRLAARAENDFKQAIKLRPDYGEAHLGLAYSYLQLRSAKAALKETDIAEKILGESRPLHLARAEAYRQRVMLTKAVPEYRAALKYQANDVPTYLALADAQYRLHEYSNALQTLNTALKYGQDPMVYAQMARSDAELHRRDDALRDINNAEKIGGGDARILLATAQALMSMGERNQAMDRYARALELSEADRLETRLALARLFAEEHHASDAREQIALGFAEARVSDATVIRAEDYLNAADVLMSLNDFRLAQQFYGRAQAAGADEIAVAIGQANSHLALGETRSAETVLTSVTDPDKQQNYDYLVSLGNAYRQRQDNFHALSAFARANSLQPDNDVAQRAAFELAGEQGRQLTDNVSVGSQAWLQPIFEDENIYQMDARFRGVQNSPQFLPPPRKSIETWADAGFHLRLGDNVPMINGFVAERNARGTISFPSELLIQRRDTYDTIFNGAITPILHVGDVKLTFTPGLQYTIRRDRLAPVPLDQDLFRQFLYVSTSSIGNWLSLSGDLIREAGPFTRQPLHSRDFSGRINFVVGRPWGKTALITGYGARDLLFRPSIHEFYESDSYVGLQRKFGTKVTASAVADYLKAWRVEGSAWTNAQSLGPAFALQITPNERWSIDASGTWSQGKGFHVYDNYTNSLLISYVKPVRGALNDGSDSVPVSYPLRFSVGVQQQTFYDFPGHSHTSIVPVFKLTLF
ncbi:MAG TPA: tetratricopeptide repeat protein [Terriglobales bacterium]|nr:tetratricopeptide repeat protein [Terriglobales bacterium]